MSELFRPWLPKRHRGASSSLGDSAFTPAAPTSDPQTVRAVAQMKSGYRLTLRAKEQLESQLSSLFASPGPRPGCTAGHSPAGQLEKLEAARAALAEAQRDPMRGLGFLIRQAAESGHGPQGLKALWSHFERQLDSDPSLRDDSGVFSRAHLASLANAHGLPSPDGHQTPADYRLALFEHALALRGSPELEQRPGLANLLEAVCRATEDISSRRWTAEGSGGKR